MAELTHYYADDATLYTTTTDGEITGYVVNWSDLTTAGFAGGDDVVMVWQMTFNNEATSGESWMDMREGSAGYASATQKAISRVEGNNSVPPNERTQPLVWFDRFTLTANNNFYFGAARTSGAHTNHGNFTVMFFGLDDLGANDFEYADNAPATTNPTTYNTDGASVTLGAAGTWWILAEADWDMGTSSSNVYVAIDVAGTDRWEITHEREDSDEERLLGSFWAESLSASDVCRVRYKTDSTTHNCDRTAIFALRLDAFEDFDIQVSATTPALTHSSVDTYQEFGGFPTYTPSQTGNVCLFGATRNDLPGSTNGVYGRIQVGGTDWPTTNLWRNTYASHGASDVSCLSMLGVASLTTGSKDVDFDCAEDFTTGSGSDGRVCVAFSLELAGGAASNAMPMAAHYYRTRRGS